MPLFMSEPFRCKNTPYRNKQYAMRLICPIPNVNLVGKESNISDNNSKNKVVENVALISFKENHRIRGTVKALMTVNRAWEMLYGKIANGMNRRLVSGG